MYIQYTHTHIYIYIYVPENKHGTWKKSPLPNPFCSFAFKLRCFFRWFFSASRSFGTHDFRPEYDMQPWEGQHSQEEWKSENLKREISIFLVTENTSFGPPKRLAEDPGNLVILGKIRLETYNNLARCLVHLIQIIQVGPRSLKKEGRDGARFYWEIGNGILMLEHPFLRTLGFAEIIAVIYIYYTIWVNMP